MPAYTADLSADAVAYYARRADAIAKGPQVYGGPWTVDTRALLRYHRNALQELTLGGRLRSLTHKQMAIAGAVARISVTQEHATITSIAKEANCVPSTASRFLLKLQAWHAYAIDVTRGRNGGVKVRLRSIGDRLEAYAQRAWSRIRMAAERALSRTNRNVASTSSFEEEGVYEVPVGIPVVMDATFMEAWDAAEARGRVLAAERAADKTPTLPREDGSVDRERVDAWVREAIHEIRVINAGDPDWDVYLDSVRASYGMAG